ncbi:uncharacterized protein LOC121057702 [Cygnus olor]|uniref:uncharacterized protein LOC121057702 n=1 Tax=Cygnus olor TaxID=8869 RepID=UPI001ADE849E|nr:uncharacterized protein LOC121057702 [Cygnus olor]
MGCDGPPLVPLAMRGALPVSCVPPSSWVLCMDLDSTPWSLLSYRPPCMDPATLPWSLQSHQCPCTDPATLPRSHRPLLMDPAGTAWPSGPRGPPATLTAAHGPCQCREVPLVLQIAACGPQQHPVVPSVHRPPCMDPANVPWSLQSHQLPCMDTAILPCPPGPTDCCAWVVVVPMVLQTAVHGLWWSPWSYRPPSIIDCGGLPRSFRSYTSLCMTCGAPCGPSGRAQTLQVPRAPSCPTDRRFPVLPPRLQPTVPGAHHPGGSALLRQPSKEPWGCLEPSPWPQPRLHVPSQSHPKQLWGQAGGAEPWGGGGGRVPWCGHGWPRDGHGGGRGVAMGRMGWLWDGHGVLWGGQGPFAAHPGVPLAVSLLSNEPSASVCARVPGGATGDPKAETAPGPTNCIHFALPPRSCL